MGLKKPVRARYARPRASLRSVLCVANGEEISGFLDVHRLVYQANQLITQLLDLSTGIGSALENSSKIREMYIANLKTTLTSLKAALSSAAHTEAN
jgi:hypothetical protein